VKLGVGNAKSTPVKQVGLHGVESSLKVEDLI
jgi:hypothetical protein